MKNVYDTFDVGAFQYLVKPVGERKFAEVFGRAAGQFYRIHRGYLINLFHVEGYDRTEVRMANGNKLLSRYKYDGFVQAYMDYISEESL